MNLKRNWCNYPQTIYAFRIQFKIFYFNFLSPKIICEHLIVTINIKDDRIWLENACPTHVQL